MSGMLRYFVLLLALPGVIATDDHSRIVNGVAATSAPYQARISIRVGSLYSFCGGVVLSESYVLTAAHCCSNVDQQGQQVEATYTVTAGTLFRSSGGVPKAADRAYIHPDWDDTQYALEKGYDLCILHLSSPFTLSGAIQPISIANNNPAVGTQVRVTGWGSTVAYSSGSSGAIRQPEALQEAMLTVLSPSTVDAWFTAAGGSDACYIAADFSSVYDYNGVIPTGNANEPVYDPCQGDSGGPVVVQTAANSYTLVGTVSHGFGCGQPSVPSIQASVVNSKAWVQQVMNGGTGLTLCNGRTCGPGAQCSGSTCVCKTGYYKAVPAYNDMFGFKCRRWLNGGQVQTQGGYRMLYELVPTSSVWGSDIIRIYDAPDDVSSSLAPCGSLFYPISAAEASTVASQVVSYLSTTGMAMPPDNQIWTAAQQGSDNQWRVYRSMSLSALFTTTLWAAGEPNGGQCAVMGVSGSTAGLLSAVPCSTQTWSIIRYSVRSTSGGGGTSGGSGSGGGGSSGALGHDISVPLLLAATTVLLFIHM